MFEQIYEVLNHIFGLDIDKLSALHMLSRAGFVYILGILLIMSNKRFIGERTPFDSILRFIIGSALASAITGNSPYFPTLLASSFMVFLNWLFAALSFYNRPIEKILKGTSELLFKDGKIQWPAMRKHFITEDDLVEEVRKKVGLEKLSQIKEAVFENSGEISIIPKKLTRTSGSDDDSGE